MPKSLRIPSPIDGRPVGSVPEQGRTEIDRAFAKLAKAQPAWAAHPLAQRVAVVKLLAQVLRRERRALADRIVREIGKTPAEALSEVDRTAQLVDATIQEAKRLKPERIRSDGFPGAKRGRVQTVERVPFGVVVAISPFNYPLNLSISKIAPALAMGNTVLWKPSTQGSVLARWFAGWLYGIGFPRELLQVATGGGSKIGDYLVSHPSTAMVAMTGSTAVGQQIAHRTGAIPLLLELGGNDPAVVLADADLDRAAQQIAIGAFKLSGQRCTAVKRVYVVRSAADRLVQKVVEHMDAEFATVGDPREHPVGPVISDAQGRYLKALVADAKRRGGRVIRGGTVRGPEVEPTVIDRVPHAARLVQEEQFGPVLPIVRVKDAAEAVRLANDTEYGLQAAVYTKNRTRAQQLAHQIQAGGVHLNGPDQRAPDNFLFIGHKASGLGAQGIRFALENFSQPKGIVSNP